jgi:CRP-like cAMP-binding protein
MSEPRSLERFELLAGMSREQLAELESELITRRFAAGEVVVREGDAADGVYLIEHGSVEILKEGEGEGESEGGQFRLNVLGPGEDFGGVSLLEHQTRSATVRALEDTTLLQLSNAAIAELGRLHPRTAYVQLLENQIRGHSDHIRMRSAEIVDALERELSAANTRIHMGSFIAYVFCLMWLYGYFMRISALDIASSGESVGFTVAMLALFSLLLLFMIWRSGQPWSVYGLTLRGWRRAAGEALVWTAGFVVFVTVVKWLLISQLPSFSDRALFELPGFSRFGPARSLGIALLYVGFAPLQEFVTRGALQSSLQRFLIGRYVVPRAIVITTILFSASHLHVSTSYALIVALPSIFWGTLYARQGTLVGVSLSHILVGLWAAFILGMPGLEI